MFLSHEKAEGIAQIRIVGEVGGEAELVYQFNKNEWTFKENCHS